MGNTDRQWFHDRLDQYLHAMNLKQTTQRKLIADCMLGMEKHFDAEELHNRLKSDGNDIGLATVYRTLNLFREAGIVNQKVFSDSSTLFEVENPDRHHDHLFCMDCGRVFEFENNQIEALQVEVASSLGFKLNSHRLDMWGHCLKNPCDFRQSKG